MIQKLMIKDFFEDNDPVSVGFYIEHREMNMHSHEFWEISYVFEGRGEHHAEDGKTIPIRENEFIFISPGTAHCITSPPKGKGGWVRVCNLLMTQEYIDRLINRFLSVRELDDYKLKNIILNKMPFCIHLKDDSGSINNMLMTAAHEYKHFTHASAEMIENSAVNLLMYISRLYENTLKNETVITTKNEVIDDLIKYIKSNFGSNISLDYLAAYVHLSPEYLSRYFKKCTGVNLSDFITETRIEKAKYRLRTSNWTINNICAYCGYQSISSFQKAFKKTVGISAGAYRELNRNMFETSI